MEAIVGVGKSKYIRQTGEVNIFRWVSLVFLFCLYVMPQYFGLPAPGFDLSVLRICLLVLLLMIFSKQRRRDEFISLFTNRWAMILVPYVLVLAYTTVLRADYKAILNPFLEFVAFFLCIYVIRYVLGIEKTIRLIRGFIYLLTLLGVLEYVMGKSPFAYLVTLDGIYTGQFVRSGHYRIMSSCTHSLGYGLLLVTTLPFAVYDEKEKKITFGKHFLLIGLIVLNVFLTGSRSTLAVILVELFLMALLLEKQQMKKLLLIGIVVAIALVAFLMLFHSTSIGQYILLQITSLIDSVFGTSYSVNYGADMTSLGSSANYRDQLKDVFKVSWLNPLLGIGRKRSFSGMINGSYIQSLDDFYVAEYVRYAYPGLLSFGLFLLTYLFGMLKGAFQDKSNLCKALAVGVWCYMLNLKWVDSLMTLKYLYVLFALFYVWALENHPHQTIRQQKASKYLRRNVL